MSRSSHIHNAHLAGDPFCWEAVAGGDAPNDACSAVLLIHGLTATSREERLLGEELFIAGYTVEGPLLPGHGTRPAALNHIRWQDWAATCQQAYERLAARYPRVYVGGESTGAVLALWLAQQNPEVAGVLAFAPAVRLMLSPQQMALLYLLSPFGVTLPKTDLSTNSEWQGYRVNPLHAILELVRLERVVRRDLGRIRQPLLVVQGRRDYTIHPTCAELVHNGAHSALKELHWLDESGHCVLLEKERRTAFDLSLAFLRKVEEEG